ncbi:MAG: protein phosphatase 2C domain-containing protein [Methanomicrobiales archaeon]
MIDGTVILNGTIVGISCTGKRNNNEDALLVEKAGDGYLLAIADGIGGHRAGEVASGIAISTLSEEFGSHYHERMSPDEIGALLSDSFKSAHKAIETEAEDEKEGMGTTMVAAFIRSTIAVIANTGDSRAYHIRERVLFRTKDHSVVQSLVDSHQISEEDARHHPLRAMITNSLGSSFLVDIYHLTLQPGDLLLLSSDGFHDYVEEDVISGADKIGPLSELVSGFVNEALRTSRDNVTVVIYRAPV